MEFLTLDALIEHFRCSFMFFPPLSCYYKLADHLRFDAQLKYCRTRADHDNRSTPQHEHCTNQSPRIAQHIHGGGHVLVLGRLRDSWGVLAVGLQGEFDRLLRLDFPRITELWLIGYVFDAESDFDPGFSIHE